jgi:hypothetical protein
MPISRLSVTSCVGLEPRPLPSTGVTRGQRYYGPLRHPGGNPACGVGPGLSLAGVRLRVTRPHRLGFPVLRWISMYRHAVVITPVARWVLIARGTAYSNRYPFIPSDGGLPHASARSATTLDVSRPAQRSLALRPVGSLHRQSDTSVSKAPTVSLPPHELPRLVRSVGRLRGGCFWLECWTTPTIPPDPSIASRCRRIWFLSVVHGHRPVARWRPPRSTHLLRG